MGVARSAAIVPPMQAVHSGSNMYNLQRGVRAHASVSAPDRMNNPLPAHILVSTKDLLHHRLAREEVGDVDMLQAVALTDNLCS